MNAISEITATDAFVTVLTTIGGQRACKLITPDKTQSYDLAKMFSWREESVPDIQRLSALLAELETDPHSFAVLGGVSPTWRDRPQIRRMKLGDDPALLDVPNRVLHLDLDDLPVPLGCSWDAPDEMARAVMDELAEICGPLDGAAFHWQASNSAAIKPGARFHFWVMLDAPINEHTRRDILGKVGADRACGLVTQPQYTARPLFQDVTDPFEGRSRHGFVSGGEIDTDDLLRWATTAVGPSETSEQGATLKIDTGVRRGNDDRVAALLSGQNVHDNTLEFSASLIAQGVSEQATIDIVRGAVLAGVEPGPRRDERLADLPRIVRGAANQFAPEKATEAVNEAHGALQAVPYQIPSEGEIPRRDWLYGNFLVRGFVAVTVAPGGVGKSSLAVGESIAMALGSPLLNQKTPKPLRVWSLNLEDHRDELARRYAAFARHHSTGRDIPGLFVHSADDRPLCAALQAREGVLINEAEFSAMEQAIRENQIDVVVLDPWVSAHQVSENDNNAVDLVAKRFARLAAETKTAVHIVHHTRKGATGEIDDARGASALVNAARSVRVLHRVDDETRQLWGVSDEQRTYFAWHDGKANLALPMAKCFYRMASVELSNGDAVGAVEKYFPPDVAQGAAGYVDDFCAVLRQRGPLRANYQAREEWAGFALAEIADLDHEKDRRLLTKMLDEFVKLGAVRIAKLRDEARHERPFFELANGSQK